MIHIVTVSTLAAAMAAVFPSSAQANNIKTLDTLVVTAHRSDVSTKRALASVTVIEREAIEASQAPDLIDLLGRQAGIDISRTGGPGQSSTVFLRGSNANHSLVLIDGLRVNSASQGVFDFAHLPLARIERIEIVRGPRAALWGSDAIGGVIHIFTRDPNKTAAELRAGSFGRFGADANTGHANAAHSVGVGVGIDRQRGFSATNANAWGHNPDNDSYRNRSVNFAARTQLGNQRIAITGLATDADVEFDQGATSARNANAGMLIGGALATAWEHSLSLGLSREDLRTPAFGSTIESRRQSLDWLISRSFTNVGTLNLGLNSHHESTLSSSDFSGTVFDRSRNNHAGFVSWHSQLQRFDYELALRHDDSSQFGSAATGQAALGWQASDTLRWRASWGEGYRAPNFNELYHPGFGGWYAGSAHLMPEQSRSREVGLDWSPAGNHRFGLSAYHTDVSELIAFAGNRAQAINIANAKLQGVELGYGWHKGAFRMQTNATWQDAINADTGRDLLRRAKRKLTASADYQFANQWQLGIDALAVSARRDFSSQLPGFARFDLRLGLPINAQWTLEARIENLADKNYQWANGYNTPDRSGLIRLRWQPGQ